MKHRPRGYRLLPMAGAALIDPRSSLQPPGLPSATAGTHKTGGPTKPSQVLDAPLLCPEPRRKLQKPSHPIPFRRSGLCYLKARWSARTFSEPALPGEGGSESFIDRSILEVLSETRELSTEYTQEPLFREGFWKSLGNVLVALFEKAVDYARH